MSDSPWVRWYPGDYFAKTGRLTRSEHGAYCLLMFHYYSTGPLPNNDADLAALSKCSKREWAHVKQRIISFFRVEGQFLRHPRCDEEIEHRNSVIAKKKEAGSLGGKRKHMLKQMLEHMPQHQPSISPSKSEPDIKDLDLLSLDHGDNGQRQVKGLESLEVKTIDPPNIERNRRIAEAVATGNIDLALQIKRETA